MILYPAIDIIDGQAVRLVQGDYGQKTVYDPDPAAVAARFAETGAKWLHVVDLDGARAGRPVNDGAIARILEAVAIPTQVGGGNRRMDDIERRLNLGVRRIVLGTAALADPALTREAARRFGDRVAVGIDARDGRAAVSGWLADGGATTEELLARCLEWGVRTVVLTDIAQDGMMAGPNFAMYERLRDWGSDIIASGGVSAPGDLDRLARSGVAGAIIGKALYTGAIDLREAIRAYDQP